MSAIGGTAADESRTVPAILHDDRVPLAAWVIAAAYVVLELAVSDRYGFQQDELYFLVASHHLAFGYVDQPPLAVLLARTTDLVGVNPTAIRILPALAGGAIVVLAARLAALFDGGRAARVIAALAGTVVVLPIALPLLPIASLHKVSGAATIADGIGWPQLTAEVAAQDAALIRAGQPPTSIFTGAYAEAGALDVYGGPYHLPLVISGHNTFWLWGPGDASDTTVLYVDAAGQLWPYFASCRQLAVYNPPDQVKNDWNDLAIGVCTGPSGSWKTPWPHMKHYD